MVYSGLNLEYYSNYRDIRKSLENRFRLISTNIDNHAKGHKYINFKDNGNNF